MKLTKLYPLYGGKVAWGRYEEEKESEMEKFYGNGTRNRRKKQQGEVPALEKRISEMAASTKTSE